MRRKLVVGNWKMNGKQEALKEIDAIESATREWEDVDVALALPATLIASAANRGSRILLGVGDVHAADSGAYTGCVSAAMVSDVGGSFTLVGHSERRGEQRETNADVKAKADAAYRHDLLAIMCVGETLDERVNGKAELVVTAQLSSSLPSKAAGDWLAIAYEPIWAIGTGRTPNLEEIAEMHGMLRERLRNQIGQDAEYIRLLYGGSVRYDNAAEVMGVAEVDGVLVGAASLNSKEFVHIVSAAR